jgi:hypothetical protein
VSNDATPWGSFVFVEVSSADPDSEAPVWIDLSDRVRAVSGLETAGGRQNELVAGEPRRLQLVLLNRDGALTSGNSSSPYYPWWKQGRRIRVREVIGARAFDLFDGHIEAPVEMAVTQEVGDTDSDVTVMVAAVDLLGRLENGRTFISTLAEHILYHGGDDLVYYWPLDNLPPVVNQASGDATALRSLRVAPRQTPDPSVESGAIVGGDDLPGCLRFGDGATGMVGLVGDAIGDGETLTIVAWLKPDLSNVGSLVLPISASIDETGPVDTCALHVRFDDIAMTWTAFVGGALFGSVASTIRVVDNKATLLAIRYTPSTAGLELWVDDQAESTTLVGSPPGTSELRMVSCPASQTPPGYMGLMAHAQVYIGSSWGHDEFLAQREVGIGGLAGQATGERVSTVANFAGVPAGRRDIDPGVTAMAQARLAGRKPTDLFAEAVATEQGRLIVSGDGRLTFHDRRRLYNI